MPAKSTLTIAGTRLGAVAIEVFLAACAYPPLAPLDEPSIKKRMKLRIFRFASSRGLLVGRSTVRRRLIETCQTSEVRPKVIAPLCAALYAYAYITMDEIFANGNRSRSSGAQGLVKPGTCNLEPRGRRHLYKNAHRPLGYVICGVRFEKTEHCCSKTAVGPETSQHRTTLKSSRGQTPWLNAFATPSCSGFAPTSATSGRAPQAV